MVNEIVNGIAKAIKSEYPDLKIYIDHVEQGLNRPCFFIAMLESSQKQHLNRRLWREHSFDIHYFPKDEKMPVRGFNEVIDQLRLALRYIEVAEDSGEGISKVQGTEMRHEVIDGVLHFFISFHLFVFIQPEEKPYMETLEHDLNLKTEEE